MANVMIWEMTCRISVTRPPPYAYPLTVECDQHRGRLPDPPPSRVSRDAKEDRKASHNSKADPELPEVARGAPDHAEGLVLLFALVLDALWERAALVAGVVDRAAARRRDLHDAELAAASEAIGYDDLLVDDVRVLRDKPGKAAGMSTYSSWMRDWSRRWRQTSRGAERRGCSEWEKEN